MASTPCSPDHVMVFLLHHENKICIVGHNADVLEMTKIVSDLSNHSESSSESLPIRPYQHALFEEIKFYQTLMAELKGVCIILNADKTEMRLTGQSSQIAIAKTKMYDVIQKAERMKIGMRSQHFIEYLMLPEIKQFIQHQLSIYGLFGAWDFTEENIINMYSTTEDQASAAIFVESVKELTITLRYEDITFVSGRQWNDAARKIEEKYKFAFVHIARVKKNELVVFYIPVVDEATMREELNNVFRTYAQSEKTTHGLLRSKLSGSCFR